ncbi:copia protein [Tanacetum coccineum]|uniref:Copia protein n=1 Tax=Tanacetum coccineum TaxID=301880 RepID=A0ABQ5IM50_9ASTR
MRMCPTQHYVDRSHFGHISLQTNIELQKDKAEDDTVDDDACKKTVQEPTSEYDQALKNVLDKMMDQEKEATEQSDAVRKEFEAQCDSQLLQEKITRAGSTNNFNTVSTPVNTASASRTFIPVGPSSGPSFVPFGGSFPIDVSNLPHDPLMPELEDTAEIRKADFNNMEPSTIISQALDDESWVEAMQEELLQFKIQKVWTLVDLPSGKKAIGTKWVYRNKKDERGIVMDVNGTIEEEVYVCQPLGFVDPEFPEKVYKVEKALYGLHQALRAWYETLFTYMLDNRN